MEEGEGWMEKRMDGEAYGWQTHGWMDGWMDGQ